MATFTDDGLNQMLRTNVGAGGTVATNWTMRLFKNNFTFVPTATLADLTEADYVGYAPVALDTWSAPSGPTAGFEKSQANQAIFGVTAGNPAQDIFGWYIQDDDFHLIGGDTFSGGPINLGGTAIALAITPSVGLAPV